jgi:hypothetical protein
MMMVLVEEEERIQEWQQRRPRHLGDTGSGHADSGFAGLDQSWTDSERGGEEEEPEENRQGPSEEPWGQQGRRMVGDGVVARRQAGWS